MDQHQRGLGQNQGTASASEGPAWAQERLPNDEQRQPSRGQLDAVGSLGPGGGVSTSQNVNDEYYQYNNNVQNRNSKLNRNQGGADDLDDEGQSHNHGQNPKNDIAIDFYKAGDNTQSR